MQKIDFKKELKHLYRPSVKQVAFVDVPDMHYLMIDGEGRPGSSSFQQAIETLYPVAYTLKFMVKRGPQQIDFGVMPLEGLWWADDMSVFTAEDKDAWKWTLMIMQPPLITPDLFSEAYESVKQKKKQPPLLSQLRYDVFSEGKAAQVLHVGPFSEEGPTVQRVHTEIDAAGYGLTGKHHEIYLSDFRRAKPENLKTIIRQPMGI